MPRKDPDGYRAYMREYMRLVDARNLQSGYARRLVDEANAHIQAAYAT